MTSSRFPRSLLILTAMSMFTPNAKCYHKYNPPKRLSVLFPSKKTNPQLYLHSASVNNDDEASPAPLYAGPALPSGAHPLGGASLGELSLDVAVASSAVVPSNGLGLYIRLSDPDNVSSVSIPALTLLSGYSREGTFESSDVGCDKTVGFALRDAKTAVFYRRRLMSIEDALRLAAETEGSGACGLAGHELRFSEEDGGGGIQVDAVDDGFARYFVPKLANRGSEASSFPAEEDCTIQNFGQFCNDLAWDYERPPSSPEEYHARSDELNVLQLVWRVEYDPEGRCLRPSWPVSVFGRDVSFSNAEFMEIGTRYGWAYWQATVDLEKI